MNDRPPLIDHDPDEPPRDTSKSPWGLAALLIGFVWIVQIYYEGPIDWRQIGLGFITGGLLVAWGVDVTGNKIPASWRRR